MAFQYVIVKNSGRGRGYLPTIMPEASYPLLPYISCMRELSLFILLISPATNVLTTMLFQYNEKGWNQYANAINLLIAGVVLLSNYVINKLTGASIDKGIG